MFCSIMVQTVVRVFRIDPKTIEGSWNHYGGIGEWWRLKFGKEGLTHKLNFKWGRYFIELMDCVELCYFTVKHCETMLLLGDLIPGPAADCPPTMKDGHNKYFV